MTCWVCLKKDVFFCEQDQLSQGCYKSRFAVTEASKWALKKFNVTQIDINKETVKVTLLL